MIDLYTWKTPNGRKASIMLEEIKIPYTVHPIDISKGEQLKPSYLQINPNNKIPAIIDNDTPKGRITIFESGAILIYLAEKTGQLLPKDPVGRSQVIEWVMWQVAGVGPMFGQLNHFLHSAPEKIPYAIDRFTKEVKRLYGVLDIQLGENQYVAGKEYTIADIINYTWVSIYDRLTISIDDYPHVKRWLEELSTRPAVIKGMKVPE